MGKRMPTVNRYTSEASPLRIAELKVPRVEAKIGLTLCPGKKGPSASDHYWDRDLTADLSIIVEWPAAAVVSLLEEFELDMLHVRELGAAIQAQEVEWFHFEITDGAPPDNRFESRWPTSCRRLCELLRQDRNILIHCRGGLGRTGTVSALLLKEFGVSSDDAIRRIRSVRPGAIETPEQEEYVRRYRCLTTIDSWSEVQ